MYLTSSLMLSFHKMQSILKKRVNPSIAVSYIRVFNFICSFKMTVGQFGLSDGPYGFFQPCTW